MLTHADAVALFDRRRRAWLAEDLDAYLALWAPDMTFASPVHPEPLDRDAFAALLRASNTATRPVRFDVRHLAMSGDTVLAEWSITIERRDDQRSIAWDGMSVCTMRDGLITQWREYWNPASLT
jgi:ketosteroid isomerase-like protein